MRVKESVAPLGPNSESIVIVALGRANVKRILLVSLLRSNEASTLMSDIVRFERGKLC